MAYWGSLLLYVRIAIDEVWWRHCSQRRSNLQSELTLTQVVNTMWNPKCSALRINLCTSHSTLIWQITSLFSNRIIYFLCSHVTLFVAVAISYTVHSSHSNMNISPYALQMKCPRQMSTPPPLILLHIFVLGSTCFFDNEKNYFLVIQYPSVSMLFRSLFPSLEKEFVTFWPDTFRLGVSYLPLFPCLVSRRRKSKHQLKIIYTDKFRLTCIK